MDDEGRSCVSAEVSDMLESVSFLNVEGKPSPMESTVLPNAEEQQVWTGFAMHLLKMRAFFYLIMANIVLVRAAAFPCPKDVFDSSTSHRLQIDHSQ